MAWTEQYQEPEGIAGDRRSDRRYQIQLDLKWKLIRRRKVRDAGVGRTRDFSSGGILFDAGRELPVGLNVELSISWPVLLHNVAPLQLVVSGKVVRSEGNLCGIQMIQHEFRTVGIPADHRDVLGMASQTPGLLSRLGTSNLGKLQ